MADIAPHHKRLIEKHIFSFFRRNAVALPILLDIRLVPIEARAIFQWIPSGHAPGIR